MSIEKRNVYILISYFLIVFCFSNCAFKKQEYKNTKGQRYGSIIEVPIDAFDQDGKIVDKEWYNFLKTAKPVGVIFFGDHLKDKNTAKNIISSVKDAVGEEMFLSADEEGGLVQRMKWIEVPYAEDVAQKYVELKTQKGLNVARQYVESVYTPMFKEMREIGLNMTFAPDLDLNKFNSSSADKQDYKNYKLAVKLVMALSGKDKNLLQKARMFKAYLDEKGIRSLDLFNNKKQFEINQQIREDWKKLDKQKKAELSKEFANYEKVANYAFVIGSRSFSGDQKITAEVAEIFVDTAKKYGIKCVMKHALGHGRTSGDTHVETQHVDVSVDELLKTDLYPYKQLINKVKFVMPAHIVFDAVDNENTAITSKKVLVFFRKNVGEAVFITDDISMNGSKNNQNPCDIWLVSHKELDEIKEITKHKIVEQEEYSKWFE